MFFFYILRIRKNYADPEAQNCMQTLRRKCGAHLDVVVLMLLKEREEFLHDLLLVVPHLLTLRLQHDNILSSILYGNDIFYPRKRK